MPYCNGFLLSPSRNLDLDIGVTNIAPIAVAIQRGSFAWVMAEDRHTEELTALIICCLLYTSRCV
ncbi:hypothetical protein [Erwinia amylovora]